MAFSSSSSENNFGDRTSFRDARFSGFNSSPQAASTTSRPDGPQFDILAWYPKYQSCQRYFVEHAQHEPLVQAFAAFINILLPYQRKESKSAKDSTMAQKPPRTERSMTFSPTPSSSGSGSISLIPYIRRLVVTGMDVPQVLHGFFGDDWAPGVGPQREQERRNYLFAAKSGGWASVKRDYDMLPLETVPFMRPLNDPSDGELEAAENNWSEWLALEDWMVGSRAPH
jgi:hypothetical protein